MTAYSNQACYVGCDQKGAGRMGFIDPAEVADFVKKKWKQRWSSLEVKYEGRLIGAISPSDWLHFAGWWAEGWTTQEETE